ncbi:C6 transcription factor [Rasamsonia emersonii CBS 393.64]|uniref:C6 transcription factor n=1 Tax=Rasamsonia emersonii (strain ATCC 16479 / CBS 393.64 / IMI 116815) TaxID=1408163 RepID=A0A0F4Z5T9_RASE3|nr:C6 transcription factor [Rasamsonia emersonii CBS 393.64]KKA25228.1 C6 transcription factor [Rasamsonia emersonii CBS 393.64]
MTCPAPSIESSEGIERRRVAGRSTGHSTHQHAAQLSPPVIEPQPFGRGFGKLHFAGYNLGEISSHNGIPLFSPEGQEWVQSRTGEKATFEKLCAFGPPWQNQHRFYTASIPADFQRLQASVELPDRKIVEEYLSIYRSSIIRLVFPFIDPVLFQETLKLAYESQQAPMPAGAASAKACVYAFLSVVSIFNLDGVSLLVDSEACSVKAQCFTPQLVQETTIDGLQTSIMLCLFQLFSGDLQSAALLSAIACRAVFMLGGNTMSDTAYVTSDPTSRVRFHLRNLFWLCYTVDIEISLRSGQPPSINDAYCDLTLPPRYVEMQYADLCHDVPIDDDLIVPLFPGDLRLSIIKMRAYNALYSVKALHKSDAELLKDIRELDDELEQWRMSVPPKYRPTLSFSHETPFVDKSMKSIILRLEYHHCVAAIHRASGRCRVWAGGQSGEMEGVSSSLALSVGASRSSLHYLRTAVHTLTGDCFWMILFYPMSALLTIFCNLLMNPLDPQAIEDLELLSRVPELVKGIRIRQLTLNEILHIKLVDDFVAELIRLGKCAVAKAQREREQAETIRQKS